jgi:hypothetical protein
MTAPVFDGSFPHNWTAEILPSRPMILPKRNYIYPGAVEEVERGALEVLVQPEIGQPFLATCALGFRDPAAPTGVWSCPDPDWLCAVSGGYAYLIDSKNPERFTMLRYRPVLDVLHYSYDLLDRSLDRQHTLSDNLLLFVGHHSILAWGRDGEAWESDRLSWEGITKLRIELHGEGWDLRTDKDLPFTLDLNTGKRI